MRLDGGGSLLVIAPHADDEVLGAGGLMLRAVRAGWAVSVWYATISGFRSADSGDHTHSDARVSEVEAATTLLGVDRWKALFVGEQHHLALDAVPQKRLIGFVEDGIHETRPTMVVMPTAGHYHQDHRAVASACLAAMRPAPATGRHRVPSILAYGHAAEGFGYRVHSTAFVDISAVLEAKIDAMACYASQLGPWPHARSAEGLRSRHRAIGQLAGCEAAEAFEVIRHVF